MIHASASINDFGPFQSEVWGTVSDWLMILVTIVTAYYLYQTLKSQKIVQEAQSRITIIENERYRHEHFPLFKVECTHSDYEKTDGGILLKPSFKITLNGGPCKYVFLKSHPSKENVVKWPLPFSYRYHYFKNGRTLHFKLTIIIEPQTFVTQDTMVSFDVECADYVNNKYLQTFRYKFSSGGGWNVRAGEAQYLQ
jgi:hypothetical protein